MVHTPGALEELVISRIDQLEEAEKALLKRAAVVGIRFYKVLLEHLAGRKVDVELNALTRRGLVEKLGIGAPGEQYGFRHAVIREVTYDSVMLKDRTMLHSAIAEWFEQKVNRPEFAGAIARHYEQAGRLNRAIEFLGRAVEHARSVYANEPARRFLEKRLSLIRKVNEKPDSHFPIEQVELLGDLFVATGRLDDALESFGES